MVDFRIRIVIDPANAKRGSKEVEGSLDRLNDRAQLLRRTLQRAFLALGGGFIVTRAIRDIANFEQAMSTVRAISAATETQFVALRTEAQRLGATTRFTGRQAAEGMLFLARAGFDTQQILEAIPGTLRLAQAGAINLGRAADIATNILTGFRQETQETSRVVDIMAFVVNSSNTNMEELGDAMKFVAPVAAGLNVSIEEASAAIGALSNNGLKASLAGTGLRRVLAGLESPTSQASKIMRELGVNADQVRISQVGLTEAIRTLGNAGIDAGLALQVFGDRGGPAFEAMRASLPVIEDLIQQLENSGGTAERIARIMDDNLNGALLAVASAYEALIFALGDLGPTEQLTQAFYGLAQIIRALAKDIRENGDTWNRIRIIAQILAAIIAARLVRAFLRFSVVLIAANGGITKSILAMARLRSVGLATATALFALNRAARVLRFSVAALGGPIGVIAIAAISILEFTNNTRQLSDSLPVVTERIEDFRRAMEELNKEQRAAIAIRIEREIQRLSIDLRNRQRELADLQGNPERALRAFIGSSRTPGARARAQERVSESSILQSGVIADLQSQINDLRERLQAVRDIDLFSETGIFADLAIDSVDTAKVFALTAQQIDDYQKLLSVIDPVTTATNKYNDAVLILADALKGELITQERHSDIIDLLKNRYEDIIDPLSAVIRELQNEARLLGLVGVEREVQTRLLQIETSLRQRGVILTEAQTLALERQLRAIVNLREARRTGGPDIFVEREIEFTKQQRTALEELQTKGLTPVEKAKQQLVDVEKLLNAAYESGNLTFDNRDHILRRLRVQLADQLDPLGEITRELQSEIRLLQLSEGAREVQGRLIEIEIQLRRAGVKLTKEQTAALEQQLRTIYKLQNVKSPLGDDRDLAFTQQQRDALTQLIRDGLNPVQQAEQELIEAEALLNDAIQAGTATMIERDLLLQRLRSRLADQLDPLTALEQQLSVDPANLRLTREEYETQIDLQLALNELRERGLDISKADAGRIESIVRQARAFEQNRQVLDELRAPMESYAQRVDTINRLQAHGLITNQEYTQAFINAQIAFLETQQDFQSGISLALLRIQRDSINVASRIERALTNAFQNMEDALVDFVRTGEINFSNLIDSFISDLARLAIRQQITGPLSQALIPGLGSLFGGVLGIGGGGIGSSLDLYGFQSGGFVPAGGFVHPGEFVINAQATRRNRGILEQINRGETPVLFGGGGGGNVNVQIIDQRQGSNSEDVDVQEQGGSDGSRFIRVLIRDNVRQQIGSGELDSVFAGRFNIRPSLVR